MGRLAKQIEVTSTTFTIESIKLYAIIDVLDESISLKGPIFVSLNKNDIVEKFNMQEEFLSENAYIAYMNLSEFGVKSSYYCDEYNVKSNWIELPLEKVDDLEDYNKKVFDTHVDIISERKSIKQIKKDAKIIEKPKKEKVKKKKIYKHFEDNRDYVLDEEPEIVYV